MYHYWFTRSLIDREVRFHCMDRALQNMDAFLAMSRRVCLREAAAALQAAPEASYHTSTGEYLALSAEQGMVTAEITLFEDSLPVRLPVDIFCRIVSEYLEEMDRMCRELGLL